MRYILFALLIISAFPIFAMENTIRFGPAVDIRNNHRLFNTAYRFDENEIYQLKPTGYMKWDQFMVNDKGLQYSFYKSLPFEVFVNGNLHGENYESTSIAKRRPTVFAGGGIRIYPLSIFSLWDLEGKSNGQMTQILLQAPVQKGPWIFFPTLGYTLYSENYAQYYYGVSANESSAQLPSYVLEKGQDSFFNFKLFYQALERWQIYTMTEYRSFHKDIENSPTVNNKSLYTLNLGLVYKFYSTTLD